MPCDKPLIAPITDECCFSCYTEGRLPYVNPIAIVLHEVDEHIEALNNRMENCCHDNPDCHSSFHYGVGHDGRIINWVDPANTAWSFDPINSDQNCGTCGWSMATQEGSGVDPNLYTINIAVSTGILAFDQSSPNSLAQNNYTENQYEAVTRLVGWLAETYGITVNQNTIWRHCDELDDFPAGCCADPNCILTYSDFLTAVQNCIDSTTTFMPWLCDTMCDAPVHEGTPTYVFGANAACDECGRYQIGPTTQENFCTLMANALTTLVPAVTPGTLLVTSGCEAAPMPTVCELIQTSGLTTGATVTDTSVTFLGDDCRWHAIDQRAIDLCAEITAEFTVDAGTAVPGITDLLGLDCQYYQLPTQPTLCQMVFAETGVFNAQWPFVIFQRTDAGDDCQTVLVDETCIDTDFVHKALGISQAGTLVVSRVRPSVPNRSISSSAITDMTTDGVLYVDAQGGDVTVTLTPPGTCEPNILYVKRTDTNTQTTVTINGGANTIDGSASITLGTPHPLSNSGMGVTLYWNGSNWTIH